MLVISRASPNHSVFKHLQRSSDNKLVIHDNKLAILII